jgi:uncharacterized protein YecT (DUF1311 family)
MKTHPYSTTRVTVLFIAAVSLVVSPPALSSAVVDPVKTLRDAAAAAEASDARLNVIYKKLTAVLTKEEQGRLLAAERAWIAYRDAECDFVAVYVDHGQDRTLNRVLWLTRLTEARTGVLSNQPFYPIPGITPKFPSSTAPADPHPEQSVLDAMETASDKETQTLQALGKVLGKDEQALLDLAQKAWDDFRGKECDFESMYTGHGTDIKLNWPSSWASMTDNRMRELQTLLAQRTPRP